MTLEPFSCIIDEEIVGVSTTQKIEGGLEGVEFKFLSDGVEKKITNAESTKSFLTGNVVSTLIGLIVKPILAVLNFFFNAGLYFSSGAESFSFTGAAVSDIWDGDSVDVVGIVGGEACDYSGNSVICVKKEAPNSGYSGGGGGDGGSDNPTDNPTDDPVCGNGVLETGESCDEGNNYIREGFQVV